MTVGQRYELEERLGTGGFGEVWRARDLLLDRPVAVKVLHAGYVQDGQALARFRAEARHAGSLAHENIARVYDYGEPDPPYLVMELVDGPSLAEVLADGPMDPVRALAVVAQAAAGLQAAHEAGLVHRDIKPGNLLIAPDGIVKITDFGISHAAGSASVTRTGQVVGTAGYLAPERVTGESATALSDLYSLGMVAYECLAGVPPFAGTALTVALAHARQPFPALPAFVPADGGALVARLAAKDPAGRPESAAEVARQARQLGDRLASVSSLPASQSDEPPGAADKPRHAGPLAAPVGGRSSRLRRPAAIGGVTVALIALLVLVLVLANVGHPGSAGHPAVASSSSATRPASRTVVTVDVNTDSLIGQPVSLVVSRLKRQGLIPRVRWQPSDQQPPGHVTAISPAGLQPVGSLVTVVGALRIRATAASPVKPSPASHSAKPSPASPPAKPPHPPHPVKPPHPPHPSVGQRA